MKRNQLLVMFLGASMVWACNNQEGDTTSTSGDSAGTTMTGDSTTVVNSSTDTSTGMGTNMGNTNYSTTPLEATDKRFVLTAAGGGLMEVELGNIAQQNAESQRVKDYAAMMVRDHTKANTELESMAGAKGAMINKDSLMNVHKGHIASMRSKTGKAFDKAYMDMMVSDHKKTINDFKKESTGGKDTDLKNFSSTNLPTLQMHLDSAQAIHKSL